MVRAQLVGPINFWCCSWDWTLGHSSSSLPCIWGLSFPLSDPKVKVPGLSCATVLTNVAAAGVGYWLLLIIIPVSSWAAESGHTAVYLLLTLAETLYIERNYIQVILGCRKPFVITITTEICWVYDRHWISSLGLATSSVNVYIIKTNSYIYLEWARQAGSRPCLGVLRPAIICVYKS